ncbi:chondroitinase family polysaccharide lyase [Maribacter sp. ACAM166]|uniref:chondroitinase family polysaccharide lyase n=1 Tax=Maribacter sp. ACAM166 TaxID=2508996 RepID=UPI0010FD64C2|nr:chondroitinase family polysaccharide lyase [Maribacter sp. ACAM166]TLP71708.1 hypothetical protein ES765_19605 [Maribacter sp. ACAM166]
MKLPRVSHNEFQIVAFLMCLFLVNLNNAQQNKLPAVESFESQEVLDSYDVSTHAKLSLTSTHRRFGKSALKWQWNGNENSFGTSNFKILERDSKMLVYEDIFPSSPTLVLSVYNEMPQVGNVKITYQKNGEDQTWFSIPLQFKGWRTIRVPFYEMEGNRPQKSGKVDYDYFKVSSDAEKGLLYFDDIVFSQYMDNRYPYPDLMVPFLKRDQDRGIDHWMPLVENLKRLEEVKTISLNPSEEKDLKLVQDRLNEEVLTKSSNTTFQEAKTDYAALGIYEKDKIVFGPPLTYNSKEVYFDSLQQGLNTQNDIKSFGQKLIKIAQAFVVSTDNAEKEKLEQNFITASRYYLNQGWQKGISGGTRHHVGYATTYLTEAFYMMREPLKKARLLSEIGQSLQWLNNLGMLLDDAENFHVNIDYLNTQAYYHLMVILLTESEEMQVALLNAYSDYLSIILAQQDEEWGFKPDGTSWHHNGHYPAYGLGAFQKVPGIFHILSGTDFRIGEAGHRNFKNALLTTAEYSQLYDWGFGNAGRHPLESWQGNNIQSLQNSYLQMAFSGNPEGTSKFDKEVSAAYLRLWGKKDSLNRKLLTDEGIIEQQMSGYQVMPYAATAIQRRANWAAIIKGYSKYVWSSEIYSSTNRYGRYPANGTVQLLNAKGEEGSGFVQEGWDWNRYPGATIVYLPLKELETEKSLLMFLSEETFAGAAQLGDSGVFGMVLNESKGLNADGLVSDRSVSFPEKLKAKKSIFSFGDKLICIGTDISSVDKEHPVQTNLFQTFLKNSDMAMSINGQGSVDGLSFSSNTGNWIVDPYGNGYHVLSENPIQAQRKEQNSYHNKYSKRTGEMQARGEGAKETKGDFATAWIDHGPAPKKASYQYVIYPFLSEKKQESFDEMISKDTSFNIIRADSIAHITVDKITSTFGYVIFDSDNYSGEDILKNVSAPSIIMLKKETINSILVSAVQPDLNFPNNEKKKNGFDNYSQPVELTLTLKGNWELKDGVEVQSLKYIDGATIIDLECQHGFSKEFGLIKIY